MAHSKKIDQLFKNHQKLKKALTILAALILVVAILAAADKSWEWDKSNDREQRMTTVEKLDLTIPELIAANNDADAIKTLVYSIADTECGITLDLLISDWGLNPPAAITGSRTAGMTSMPQDGFKQISAPFDRENNAIPAVYRYINRTRNEIIYYVEGRGSSCHFNLFETTNAT